MKPAIYITTAIVFLSLSACSPLPSVAIEVGYESPNTGIDYKVKRNHDGSYVVIAQK